VSTNQASSGPESSARKTPISTPATTKAQKLWACHLGPELGGQGYGQVKLALLNEKLGRVGLAPVVFGCQAPDTGNAEIIAHYGTDEQKERYLKPLARGELIGGLGKRMRRQVLVVRRTVVAGVGEDVQAGGVCQALEQPDIASDVGRCALEHAFTPKLANLHEMRERDLEGLIRIVPARVHLPGADEVHQHVLVHERDAKPAGGDRSGDTLDHARRVPAAASR
jgi:hypothetical protein